MADFLGESSETLQGNPPNTLVDRVCLIVPCYNERQRLQIAEFRRMASKELHFLFVDDGSKDQTSALLATEFAGHPHVHVFALQKNQGKAEAVRRGVLELIATGRVYNYDWVGYWDADLATPLTEVRNMLLYANTFYPDISSIWGSRVYRLGSHIQRSALRHYLGRAFATFIFAVLRVESYDSQCGAKLFRVSALDLAFREIFLSRWVFDVEILLRLQELKIVEYPLIRWKDVAGSKIKVYRELTRVFKDVMKIRKRYLGVSHGHKK